MMATEDSHVVLMRAYVASCSPEEVAAAICDMFTEHEQAEIASRIRVAAALGAQTKEAEQ